MMTVITVPPSCVPGDLNYFFPIKAPYLCWSLDQSSPTTLICFFIDFDYTVIIHYLCISHNLTILISFSCNYTAPSHCVIDTLLSSTSLPFCCCVPVLWKIKYNEMFGCACVCLLSLRNCHWGALEQDCVLLEFIFMIISSYYSFICPCSCYFSIILI